MTNVKHLSIFSKYIKTTKLNKFSFGRSDYIQLHQLFQQTYQQSSTMPSNSSTSYNYMYLHGFASGKGSSKGQLLKKYFAEQPMNVDLQLPDLNIPSFEKLSITEIVKYLKNEILSNDQQYRIIGSSLGGLIAATLALELRETSKIQSLILLCPALDASNRWRAKLSDSELHQWKLDGTKNYYHFNTKSERPLHYGFYEDLLQHVEYPLVNVPLTIIHGLIDDVVPITISRTYLELLRKNGSDNELIEVNDDHYLMKDETTKVIKNVIKKMWFDGE